MPFVKLDTRILDSSLWAEDSDTRIVWVTLLTMADAMGVVESTAPGISRRAVVSLDATIKALEIFEAPDRWNKNPDHDGHRIERVERGYLIVNYESYRSRDHTNAERQRRFRDAKSSAVDKDNGDVPLRNALRNSPSASASASSSLVVSKKEGESEREETIALMGNVFNEVFSRKTSIVKTVLRKGSERLKRGDFKPWQLVALPILVAAQGVPKDMNMTVETLLRDGKHPKTQRDGSTCGATDWAERAYLKADQTKLDQRLSHIARAADTLCPGLLSGLKRYNVSIMDPEPRVEDEAF